jgi:hypothetical protein
MVLWIPLKHLIWFLSSTWQIFPSIHIQSTQFVLCFDALAPDALDQSNLNVRFILVNIYDNPYNTFITYPMFTCFHFLVHLPFRKCESHQIVFHIHKFPFNYYMESFMSLIVNELIMVSMYLLQCHMLLTVTRTLT